MKNLTFGLALLLCSGSLHARVTCTNVQQVGTFEGTTTYPPETGQPPALSFYDPGVDPATSNCTAENCTTLPCLLSGCDNLPFNTNTCLSFLVSQCGTAAPVIRQVTLLSSSPCL